MLKEQLLVGQGYEDAAVQTSGLEAPSEGFESH